MYMTDLWAYKHNGGGGGGSQCYEGNHTPLIPRRPCLNVQIRLIFLAYAVNIC